MNVGDDQRLFIIKGNTDKEDFKETCSQSKFSH